jgi:tetratricopeptide (TPR) repeat protein
VTETVKDRPGTVLGEAPEDAGVLVERGVVLFKRGLYRQAEAELKRALELDDQNGDAYFYRGEALNQLGRVDDALEMLERAVQYRPSNGRAYYTMGILYDRKHLGQEACAMYRRAREVGGA